MRCSEGGRVASNGPPLPSPQRSYFAAYSFPCLYFSCPVIR